MTTLSTAAEGSQHRPYITAIDSTHLTQISQSQSEPTVSSEVTLRGHTRRSHYEVTLSGHPEQTVTSVLPLCLAGRD